MALDPSKQVSNEKQHEGNGNKGCCEKYKDIISTLPREFINYCDNYKIGDFWYDDIWAPGVFWAQENFRAQPTDIILATFPKCGTTWLKALMFATLRRKDYDSSCNPLLVVNPHKCVPYFEILGHEDDPISILNSFPTPRLFGTHVAYSHLPESVTSLGSKIVCISRNPKDVFVSIWMFINNIAPVMGFPNLDVEKTFDAFCRGVGLSGPFWEYNLEYWRASLEHPNNVLFIKFEDLKKDTKSYVKKLAEFMGCPFSLEEEKGGVVEEVIKLCSLQNLSNLEVNKNGTYQLGSNIRATVPNSAFFRRGAVGDSKNFLTPEMIKRLDEITEQKLKGSGLSF